MGRAPGSVAVSHCDMKKAAADIKMVKIARAKAGGIIQTMNQIHVCTCFQKVCCKVCILRASLNVRTTSTTSYGHAKDQGLDVNQYKTIQFC